MMNLDHREVFVPVVSVVGVTDIPLARFRCGNDPVLPDDRGLDPKLSNLFESGFYDAGTMAQTAVTGLSLHPGILWRWLPGRRWLLPWYSFSIQNPQAFPTLLQGNELSAQLGLALLLLTYLCQQKGGTLIATGALSPDAGGRDADVLPVAHITTKLGIITNALQTVGRNWPRPIRLFLPHTENDASTGALLETPLRDNHRQALEYLEAHGVQIFHIAKLSEGMTELGLNGLVEAPHLRTIRHTLSAVAVAAGVVATGAWALDRPFPMGFADTAEVRASEMPVRALSRGTAKPIELDPCIMEGQRQAVRVGETLLMRVAADAGWGRLQPTLITVGEESGVNVWAGAILPTRENGSVLSIRLDAREPAEEMRIIIAAQRMFPIDANELGIRLKAIAAQAKQGERLNDVILYLQDRMPGLLVLAPLLILPKDDLQCR